MDLKDIRIKELEATCESLKEIILALTAENLRLQGIPSQDGPGTIDKTER